MQYHTRSLLAAFLLLPVSSFLAAEPLPWPAVTLAPAGEVTLAGPLGESLRRGVARLAEPPYTQAWLQADVSFELKRIFTNYSGDVSGRFIELASLTTPADRLSPSTLGPVLKKIAQFQKADGHFGVEIDLNKPLKKNSPPIPMLWGNARLLVGLVTAAGRFHNDELLASARRLGDFYVSTADQLCLPAREADYRSSGTGGDGYTCCYFPAIEGLALLYQATRDDRYLKQAQRMADFFTKFDCLPIDHSHGNLCAWRGILDLYEITANRSYLDRARAKWDAAMKGGFVWPLGGIGEHWYVSFHGDEGCSESDWLRFNLDLWRFTGQTRYLDIAERLIENQYATNQCPNGGFGMAHMDGGAAGPVATVEKIEEWPFCCSFHGPLGLHFLKGYLATGSERGVFINFPYDFTAAVNAAGREWAVSVHSQADYLHGKTRMEIDLAPREHGTAYGTLWVRMPEWASSAKVATRASITATVPAEGGYIRIDRQFQAGDKLTVDFQSALRLEGRKFAKLQAAAGKVSRVNDVAVLAGPQILFAAPVRGGGRPVLLATLDAGGRLAFPISEDKQFVTVELPDVSVPGANVTQEQIAAALRSGRPVVLRTWPGIVASRHAPLAFQSVVAMGEMGGSRKKPRRLPFMFDLVVVPAASLGKDLGSLAARAKCAEDQPPVPIYGEHLEKRPEIWPSLAGWKFTPQGLLVSRGDAGLIDGQGYADYRFEFTLTLPKEGQGISGWIVRAKDEANCLMFQLQSADSEFRAPEFKTRPNTLRPHRRTGGHWQIAEPIALPKEIRKGEPHQVAVECRQGTVEVFLDGQRIYSRGDIDLRGGSVGFRAAGPAEQGFFQNVSLKKL